MESLLLIDSLLKETNRDHSQLVVKLVDELLVAAVSAGASDMHFHPTQEGLRVKWRMDGVMQSLGTVPTVIASNVVVRLKVLSGLLTYQTNLPQEGRLRGRGQDIRISSFPTMFGEKVVARILSQQEETKHERIHDLGLPANVTESLATALTQTAGMILIVGPAGSGKTTSAYACLREIIAQSGGQRSLVSMEDPIEMVIADVAQSEVVESVGFNLTSGLRSLVRQDPDVIFVGEIRDPATASIAYQAAMTGQLVITTFHAGDAATAVSRLLDMEIPSYVVRSATNLVVAQRLLRKLCSCSRGVADSQLRGCPTCHQTGYCGRCVAAEQLSLENSSVRGLIRKGVDAQEIRRHTQAEGFKSLPQQARQLVTDGVTTSTELLRVFGLGEMSE